MATRQRTPHKSASRLGRLGHLGRLGRLSPPAIAALAAIALAACASSSSSSSSSAPPSSTALPTAPASSSVSLSETGSTLLYPLFNLWVPDYKTAYPQVTITTAGTGSGTGISSAAGGTADIGASDAYLSPSDVSQYPTLLNIPLAISAQMVTYNLPGFTGTLKLNGTVLAEMYQGTITMWNDPAIAALNPGVTLPAMKIVPLHRSDSSGDTFLFTTYLSDQDSAWSSSVGYDTTVAWPSVAGELAFKGNSGMVAGCQDNPGCVAYIGISYKSKTTAAGLGEAEVANGAGQYELPTAATIAAAAASFSSIPASGAISLIDSKASGAYPIINYEYAIVNSTQPNATKAQDIKALLYWAITTGNSSKYLSQVNFQPLPSTALAVSEALLAKIGS
ncbi:phosphate ABC transporter substrate-binding protein PstS [Trebonia sp.]|uniref:phosphate ABC transporter substrate-binding protein PstS n=1 Tax=Trebonia sp. TaxID=2767075 RepID=UPI002616486A|nr:phosphate ABC transporter substrate-binding protein PstS [Trebonia sp.]